MNQDQLRNSYAFLNTMKEYKMNDKYSVQIVPNACVQYWNPEYKILIETSGLALDLVYGSLRGRSRAEVEAEIKRLEDDLRIVIDETIQGKVKP